MKDIGKSSYLPKGIVDATYGNLKGLKSKAGGYTSNLSKKLDAAADKYASKMGEKIEAGLVKAEKGINHTGEKAYTVLRDNPEIRGAVGFGTGATVSGGTAEEILFSTLLGAAVGTGIMFLVDRQYESRRLKELYSRLRPEK